MRVSLGVEGITWGHLPGVCHSVCEGVYVSEYGWDLVMDAIQDSLGWGPYSKMGLEKGGTHISQVIHPWGMLSSGGKWCSSVGLGPLGHVW